MRRETEDSAFEHFDNMEVWEEPAERVYMDLVFCLYLYHFGRYGRSKRHWNVTMDIAWETWYTFSGFHILTMLDFLVGWVRLAESQLLAINLVSLPDYVWIVRSLNPIPNLTLSRYWLFRFDF